MKTRSMTVKPSNGKSLAIFDSYKIEKKRKKSQPKKKTNGYDPKKPKKPPTAFFYYLQDFKKTYQSEHPDVKTMRDIGKACGDKWRTMTFDEKVQYYDIATEKRAEYEKTLAAYVKRKESGEFLEESDDDE